MNSGLQRAARSFAFLVLAALVGCDKRSERSEAPAAQSAVVAVTSAAPSVSAATRGWSPPAPEPSAIASSAPNPASSTKSAKKAAFGPKLVGQELDLTTGAFISLGSVGALVRRRDDEMLLIRLDAKPVALPEDGKLFARSRTLVIDRSDGVAAYWMTDGKLVRRLIDREGKVSPLETLANDVEDGFAPHGVRHEGGATATAQDVVAYVSRRRSAEGDRRAKLWVEGKGVRDLAPEGSGASSVHLSLLGPGRIAALWLDARSALAPLHAMTIELDAAGEPLPSNETTVWIAPPSELFSQVTAVRPSDQGPLMALIAMPKNGIEFGLAAVPVSFGAPPAEAARWLDYPNGLDPAPVISARFCGLPAAVIVRPTDKPIDAPKVIELVTVDASALVTPRLEIARAGRVDHLTAWVSPAGEGWVAWVGDGRTRARKIQCGK